MEYEAIRFERQDAVAILTLNRPDRLNAWTDGMALELSHALGVCNSDDGVRVVVLTGAGRAFCAGADLAGGGDTFGDFVERRESEREPRSMLFPWQLDKPVIAAINGHAIGVGITYPMMCDIRFVAEDAKIQFAFVRRGILPELASHTIVARVAGLSNAADLLFSGRMILGREAAAIGIASAALPTDEVLPVALERAHDMARNAAPMSVAISKRLLWDGITLSVADMKRREDRLFAWLSGRPDAREGIVSFIEKRPPEWKLSVANDKPDELS